MEGMLVGWRTITEMHIGGDRGEGPIDLPIIREKPSDWPFIPHEGLKGALRAKARGLWGAGNPEVARLFGPEKADAGGLLGLDQGSLLLLPVRSLDRHYYYVTAPEVLRRLEEKAQMTSFGAVPGDIPEPQCDHALVANTDGGAVYLEDMALRRSASELGKWIKVLAKLSGRAEETLRQRLVIVTDDDFRILCQFATPVHPHIKLDPQSKVNKTGAFWYKEAVAMDTTFYSAFQDLSSKPADDQEDVTKEDLPNAPIPPLRLLVKLLDGRGGFTRFGGGATLGLGYCRVVKS